MLYIIAIIIILLLLYFASRILVALFHVTKKILPYILIFVLIVFLGYGIKYYKNTFLKVGIVLLVILALILLSSLLRHIRWKKKCKTYLKSIETQGIIKSAGPLADDAVWAYLVKNHGVIKLPTRSGELFYITKDQLKLFVNIFDQRGAATAAEFTGYCRALINYVPGLRSHIVAVPPAVLDYLCDTNAAHISVEETEDHTPLYVSNDIKPGAALVQKEINLD